MKTQTLNANSPGPVISIMDHLQKTAETARDETKHSAQIIRITEESPSVKRLLLRVQADPSHTFKAGQWVDFFIPDVATVGGFSVCSSPCLYQEKKQIELAVKNSSHPPAHWVHSNCSEGIQVDLKFGGDFFYDPSPTETGNPLLLLAGGVGINPLISILLHATSLPHCPSIRLLFSAKGYEELLFKEEILSVCKTLPQVSVHFFLTGETSSPKPLNAETNFRRVSQEDILHSVEKLGPDCRCYICGPVGMIQFASGACEKILPKTSIFYESWW